MFLKTAIHGAAAQSQSLGCLADISFVARERALDEITLNFIEAHLLQLGRAASGLRAQTEVCRAYRRAGQRSNPASPPMMKFPTVAGPGMPLKSLGAGVAEPGKAVAVP